MIRILKISLTALFGTFVLLCSFSYAQSNALEVSPDYEGLYSLTLRCPNSGSNNFCKNLEKETFTLVVSAIHSIKNTSISIVRDSIGLPAYLFGVTQIMDNGERLQGNSRGKMNTYSEVELSFHSDGVSVSGYLRDPRHDFDLKFTGKSVHKIADILTPAKSVDPLSPFELVGVYDGIASSTSHHILSIYPSSTEPNENFYAQLRDKDSGATIEFTGDYFSSRNRRLTLLSHSALFGEAAPLKWNLNFDKTQNGETIIKGFAVSALNGAAYEVHFKKR